MKTKALDKRACDVKRNFGDARVPKSTGSSPHGCCASETVPQDHARSPKRLLCLGCLFLRFIAARSTHAAATNSSGSSAAPSWASPASRMRWSPQANSKGNSAAMLDDGRWIRRDWPHLNMGFPDLQGAGPLGYGSRRRRRHRADGTTCVELPAGESGHVGFRRGERRAVAAGSRRDGEPQEGCICIPDRARRRRATLSLASLNNSGLSNSLHTSPAPQLSLREEKHTAFIPRSGLSSLTPPEPWLADVAADCCRLPLRVASYLQHVSQDTRALPLRASFSVDCTTPALPCRHCRCSSSKDKTIPLPERLRLLVPAALDTLDPLRPAALTELRYMLSAVPTLFHRLCYESGSPHIWAPSFARQDDAGARRGTFWSGPTGSHERLFCLSAIFVLLHGSPNWGVAQAERRQHRTVAAPELLPDPKLHPSPSQQNTSWTSYVATKFLYILRVSTSCSFLVLRLPLSVPQNVPKLTACRLVRSSDWHLPSPTSTPKSVGPDPTLKTPRTELFPQSHFLDAWSTPRVNGQQTPAQTPTFAISTPIERPSTSQSLKVRTPEDPDFHVNHFAVTNLPLPPVDPSRRLSSSPDPQSVNNIGAVPQEHMSTRPRPLSMDTSQMQTPPPTRGATSRRLQHSAGNVSTPATVVARTPGQAYPGDGWFSQTPLGYPSLQFSPDMVQFPSTGPMSAPALPHSRLFWDQSHEASRMDVDMPLASDPFGPTPHKIEGNMNWQTFHTPADNQMNPQAFQPLQGLQSSPGLMSSFATSNAGDVSISRPASFVSTSGGVDPSMLFSFSSPGPASSFNMSMPMPNKPAENRQPYETQLRESMREREVARKSKGQHSRTSTNSSNASFEARPGLQRSNTDSGFRKSRPSSMESRSSGSAVAYNIPRRSSPLKRSSGGSLMAIPEVRRPRTRLIIDETGRARTETVPADEEEEDRQETRKTPLDLRAQYPGLWNDEDDSYSEEEVTPQAITLSRNASFNMPQRRTSKHARNDSGEISRSNSFKIPRPASRPSSVVFDKASFDTVRPVRRVTDNSHRRFSMMDFPSPFDDPQEGADRLSSDSPGDALGALKKAVAGRQKQRSAHNTLHAHNQRWAQASADIAHGQPVSFDPFSNAFSVSPANTSDTALTTPSTDRSSLSNDTTRCVCNGSDDGRPMILCESCRNWLHMPCVGILHENNLPPVYVCVFCTGQTPLVRGGRVRGPMPGLFDSPLTHKSVYRR
ncbi:hypothetical protein P171DRAFT_477817 [Karstenula rhodostoma CBS 690.94]|uniref:Zinc finger PHD-type domain-containing protein n=1 Tax=Karstenula rhodostoma CBS 690.94 TaxID=1392251 RepID=A0A9P4P6T7_9PLEO|nr:hypothetical protein P171DRAFT_477817 [Karstenula rhodostoma CBS 690.94]